MTIEAQVWRKHPDGSSTGRGGTGVLVEKGKAWSLTFECPGTWIANLGETLGVRIGTGDTREAEARVMHITHKIDPRERTILQLNGIKPLAPTPR